VTPVPPDDDPRSLKLRRIERGVEERLARLAESGELSGLPGEGLPFPDRGEDQAGDRWAAFRIMAQNRVLPGWAQLRREIEAERERLVRAGRAHREWRVRRRAHLVTLPAERLVEAARATEAREARVRGEIAAAVQALNAQVDRLNGIVPADSLQLAPFRVDSFLERDAVP
jgi:hypothetical protein